MYRVIRVFLFFVRLQAKQNKKKSKIIIEICMKSKKEGPNRRYCSTDYCFSVFQTNWRTRPYHRNMTRAFATCTSWIMTRFREVLAEFFQRVFRKRSLICRTGKGKSTEKREKNRNACWNKFKFHWQNRIYELFIAPFKKHDCIATVGSKFFKF